MVLTTTPNAIAGPSVEEAVERLNTWLEYPIVFRAEAVGEPYFETPSEETIRTVLAALSSLQAELRAVVKVLEKTNPILAENYRWHRDMQSSPGRTIEAHEASQAAASLHARLQTLTGVNTDG